MMASSRVQVRSTTLVAPSVHSPSPPPFLLRCAAGLAGLQAVCAKGVARSRRAEVEGGEAHSLDMVQHARGEALGELHLRNTERAGAQKRMMEGTGDCAVPEPSVAQFQVKVGHGETGAERNNRVRAD